VANLEPPFEAKGFKSANLSRVRVFHSPLGGPRKGGHLRGGRLDLRGMKPVYVVYHSVVQLTEVSINQPNPLPQLTNRLNTIKNGSKQLTGIRPFELRPALQEVFLIHWPKWPK